MHHANKASIFKKIGNSIYNLSQVPPIKLQNIENNSTIENLSSSIKKTSLALIIFCIFCLNFSVLPDATLLNKSSTSKLPSIIGLELPLWYAMVVCDAILTFIFIRQNMLLKRLFRTARRYPKIEASHLIETKGVDAKIINFGVMFILPIIASWALSYKVSPFPRKESLIIFTLSIANTSLLLFFIVNNVVKIKKRHVQKRITTFLMLILPLLSINFFLHLFNEYYFIEYRTRSNPRLGSNPPNTARNLNLDRASFKEDGDKMVDLRDSIAINASIINADFSNTNLSGSNFSLATIRHSNFSNSIIEQSTGHNSRFYADPNFDRTVIIDSSFENSKISEASFNNSYIVNVTFTESLLKRVSFIKAELRGTLFNNVSFGSEIDRFSDFSGAYLHTTSFINSDIRQIRFTEGDHKASIIGTNFSGIRFGNQALSNSVDHLCYIIQQGAGWQLTLRDPELACGAKILPEFDAPEQIDLKNAVIDSPNIHYWTEENKFLEEVKDIFSCENLRKFKNWQQAKGRQVNECKK